MAEQHSHRLRPKGAEKWQHVTGEQLKTITAQVGERTLRDRYQVEEMEKAASPPPALTTPAKPEKAEKTEAKKD
jgi:hypothetical protein